MAFGDNSDGQMGDFGGDTSENTTNSANETYDFSSFEAEQQGGDDANELLRASPFGPLLDIPGVDGAEDIFGNVGGDAGGLGGDASTMGDSGSGVPSGNPFANFNPLEDGNPLIEGDEPDVSFGSAGGQMDGFGGDTSEIENADSGADNSSVSSVFPENAGSYNYDFSQVEGQYDFSSNSGNSFAGGIPADVGSEISWENSSDQGSNPSATGDLSSADTGSSFGGTMDSFGI
ncbi:MAG: hypothetical protein KME09_08665 [Pleurocapsa minor HA4230-MV1]|jgi:hypothetical protein|nr:hypothetical protein [Pleurocapsa minor HA4230-MV1]